MIKESKIKTLLYTKVADIIENKLKEHGFKWQKSKQRFYKQYNEYEYVIHLNHPYSPLIYDEATDHIILKFSIYAEINIPGFEKWYFEKVGEQCRFPCKIGSLESQVELSAGDFSPEDFHTPTASQEFKHRVGMLLTGINEQTDKTIPLDDFIGLKLPELVSSFTSRSDVLKIFEDGTLDYACWLSYKGLEDLAKEQFDLIISGLIEKTEDTNSADDFKLRTRYLGHYIMVARKTSSLIYENPYEQQINILNPGNDSFVFSLRTHFNEYLRLDISMFTENWALHVHLNQSGEILLFYKDRSLYKMAPDGKVIFEKELEPAKGFDKLYYTKTGLIAETDEFFINNYILRKDNHLLELPLPVVKSKKKGRLQNPNISALAYDPVEDKYLVLYKNYLLTYSKDGKPEKTVSTDFDFFNSSIITGKKWIVTRENDTRVILDFDGQVVGTYDFANGNHLYEFSDDHSWLLCFFYAIKSQLYHLETGKKETLWAHPTYIKGYKETMYHDINHNFGMDIAKFSPDGKYIVGGADHGKYVAWTLPGLERVELIPQPEMIDQLEPLVTIQLGAEGSQTITTKPELVVLNNKTYLKNRENGIRNIIFLENGDLFLTELNSGFILLWDRNFQNLSYRKTEGEIKLHLQKYLTQKTKTELILYKPG